MSEIQELEPGDKFIPLTFDQHDNCCGDSENGYFLFVKLRLAKNGNATRLIDGASFVMPQSTLVIKIKY